MPKLMRIVLFQTALESTFGEDPNGSYQALMPLDDSEVSVEGEQVTRNVLKSSMSNTGHVIGLKDQSITSSFELRGASVDAGVLQIPEIDHLLKASCMKREDGSRLALTSVSGTFERGETVTNDTATNTVGTVADWDGDNNVLYIRDLQNEPSASDSVSGDTSSATGTVDTADDAYVYRPISPDVADMPSAVARYFLHGIRHRLLGSRCTFSINMNVGQNPTISFTINGLYEKPIDQSHPSVSYLQLNPQPVFGANLTIGSLDTSKVAVTQMTMDLGNQIEWRNDLQAAAGRRAPIIFDRDTTGSVDPEVLDLSGFDPYTDWENANEVAMAIGIGSEAGKRIRVVAQKTQYTELPYSERNGIATYNLGFRAIGEDDELFLIYS